MTGVVMFVATCVSLAGMSRGDEIVNIVFEAGAIDSDPAWQLLQNPLDANATPRAKIGSTGRAFQTGTDGNDEALYITPGEGGFEKFFEGAVWQLDSSQAIRVADTSVVFVETETFSDLASSFSQWYKIDIAAGIRGNGESLEGGFHSDEPLSAVGETHVQANANYSTDPTGVNQQKVQFEGNSLDNDFRFANTNWDGPATPEALEATYVNRFAYRHVFDGDQAIGSQANIVGAAGIGVTPRLIGATDGPVARFLPDEIDRITVQMLRHGDVPNSSPNFIRYSALAPGVTEQTAKIGVKSLRVGITGRTDFDLSYSTTASGDGALLLANLGDTSTGNPQGEKLFFEGDADGDARVTASGDGALLLADLAPSGFDAGVATAIFNPSSGAIEIEATGVARISLFSTGGNLQTVAGSVDDFGGAAAIDHPSSHDLTWFATENVLGLGSPDRIDGNIVRVGTQPTDLTLIYQRVGGEAQLGNITVVPEPSTGKATCVLLVIGLGIRTGKRRN